MAATTSNYAVLMDFYTTTGWINSSGWGDRNGIGCSGQYVTSIALGSNGIVGP
jgi:hypothetical protein